MKFVEGSRRSNSSLELEVDGRRKSRLLSLSLLRMIPRTIHAVTYGSNSAIGSFYSPAIVQWRYTVHKACTGICFACSLLRPGHLYRYRIRYHIAFTSKSSIALIAFVGDKASHRNNRLSLQVQPCRPLYIHACMSRVQ